LLVKWRGAHVFDSCNKAEENSNQPLINTLLQHIEDIKKELEKKKSEESENVPGSCSSYYC
jgi:hypothetical protein